MIDFQIRAKRFENDSFWVKNNEVNSVPLTFLSPSETLGDLLDAGGGTGYLSYFLSTKFNCESISLVDSSSSMLEKAREKNFQVKTFNSSIEEFCEKTNMRFKTVLIRQVLHYVDDVDKVILALKSVLNENGVIYAGQILMENEDCGEWHDTLIKEISANRRRTFLIENFNEIFIRNGLEIVKKEITVLSENLNDFYKRRVSDNNFDCIKERMKNITTENVIEKMNIKITNDNIYFNVKFGHLLLKAK